MVKLRELLGKGRGRHRVDLVSMKISLEIRLNRACEEVEPGRGKSDLGNTSVNMYSSTIEIRIIKFFLSDES